MFKLIGYDHEDALLHVNIYGSPAPLSSAIHFPDSFQHVNRLYEYLYRKIFTREIISPPWGRDIMIVHKKREDVIKRLARIEGHVRGVRRMVEEGRSCPEILLQLAAIRAALNKVGQIILEDHLETCISKAIKEGAGEGAVAELKEAIARFL